MSAQLGCARVRVYSRTRVRSDLRTFLVPGKSAKKTQSNSASAVLSASVGERRDDFHAVEPRPGRKP